MLTANLSLSQEIIDYVSDLLDCDELVPVWEVAAAMRRLHGTTRQDFQAAAWGLRRARQVRLIAISDLRDASEEQLAECLEGECETLGYFTRP